MFGVRESSDGDCRCSECHESWRTAVWSWLGGGMPMADVEVGDDGSADAMDALIRHIAN
jgi:hypothetical protein